MIVSVAATYAPHGGIITVYAAVVGDAVLNILIRCPG